MSIKSTQILCIKLKSLIHQAKSFAPVSQNVISDTTNANKKLLMKYWFQGLYKVE